MTGITEQLLRRQYAKTGRAFPEPASAAVPASTRTSHPADLQARRRTPISPTRLTIDLPLATCSESNTGGRLKSKMRRKGFQRGELERLLTRNPLLPALPITVTITRSAPRDLDFWDNLPSATKFLIDAVAAAYGTTDADPRLRWLPPAQQRAKTYGIRIELTSIPETPPIAPRQTRQELPATHAPTNSSSP